MNTYLRNKLNLNTVYLLSETEGPDEKIFWLVMSYGAGPSAAIWLSQAAFHLTTTTLPFPLSALISWGCTREVGLFSEAFVRFFSIKARGGPYGIYLIRRSGMQYRWVLLRVVPFGNKIQTKSVITKQYYTPKILISYFIILLLFSAKWFPSFLIRRESKTDREV